MSHHHSHNHHFSRHLKLFGKGSGYATASAGAAGATCFFAVTTVVLAGVSVTLLCTPAAPLIIITGTGTFLAGAATIGCGIATGASGEEAVKNYAKSFTSCN